MPTPKTTAPTPTEAAPAALRRPRLMTTADLAELLQIHPDVVKRWRTTGDGPAFVTLSRTAVRYQPRAVSEWLEARQRTSTKDNGSRRARS